MKFFGPGVMVLGVIVLLSGCATTSKNKGDDIKAEEKKPNITKILEKDTIEARKFAELQAANYFKALKDKDYEAFCKSKKMSKKKFEQWYNAINKSYGKLKSQKYIGSIVNPLIIRYMWQWNFTREVKEKTFTRQALYNVFIVKDKDKNKFILFTTGLQ